jgi:DNA-binding NtrC family response regulator
MVDAKITVSFRNASQTHRGTNNVGLLACDVFLPGKMGGFSLAVWIRHHFRSIPVVLTSGVDSAVRPLDRQNLVPFLAKPYRMEEAEKLIASVLAKSPFAKQQLSAFCRNRE